MCNPCLIKAGVERHQIREYESVIIDMTIYGCEPTMLFFASAVKCYREPDSPKDKHQCCNEDGMLNSKRSTCEGVLRRTCLRIVENLINMHNCQDST